MQQTLAGCVFFDASSGTEPFLTGDEDECIEASQDCWTADSTKHVSYASSQSRRADGDEITAERAALLDEITDEFAAIASPEISSTKPNGSPRQGYPRVHRRDR